MLIDKVRTLFVVCLRRLHLYSYNSEACDQNPVKDQTLSFSEDICGVYVIKRSIVIVFLQKKFEVFEFVQDFGKSKMNRKSHYQYIQNDKEKKSSL
jgi:hypothetical protein